MMDTGDGIRTDAPTLARLRIQRLVLLACQMHERAVDLDRFGIETDT